MDRSTLTPEALHARYARKIDRHVRRVMGGDTEREDLVQDVLLTVIRKYDTLRDPAALDAWVGQVTANMLNYAMRRRRVRRHVSWETLPEKQVAPVLSRLDARDLASRAVRVLHLLPETDRTLLMTHWFTPATADVIAHETHCSVITVRRRLSKARRRFEKLARRDPALAHCIDDARVWSRRWRQPPSE
jgi:RNA polymerase sigma-70 factor (ECF subfamily)